MVVDVRKVREGVVELRRKARDVRRRANIVAVFFYAGYWIRASISGSCIVVANGMKLHVSIAGRLEH